MANNGEYNTMADKTPKKRRKKPDLQLNEKSFKMFSDDVRSMTRQEKELILKHISDDQKEAAKDAEMDERLLSILHWIGEFSHVQEWKDGLAAALSVGQEVNVSEFMKDKDSDTRDFFIKFVRRGTKEERLKIGQFLKEKSVDDLLKEPDWATACLYIATAKQEQLDEITSLLFLDPETVNKIIRSIRNREEDIYAPLDGPVQEEFDFGEDFKKRQDTAFVLKRQYVTEQNRVFYNALVARDIARVTINSGEKAQITTVPAVTYTTKSGVEKIVAPEQNVYIMLSGSDKLPQTTKHLDGMHRLVENAVANIILQGRPGFTIDQLIRQANCLPADRYIPEETKRIFTHYLWELAQIRMYIDNSDWVRAASGDPRAKGEKERAILLIERQTIKLYGKERQGFIFLGPQPDLLLDYVMNGTGKNGRPQMFSVPKHYLDAKEAGMCSTTRVMTFGMNLTIEIERIRSYGLKNRQPVPRGNIIYDNFFAHTSETAALEKTKDGKKIRKRCIQYILDWLKYWKSLKYIIDFSEKADGSGVIVSVPKERPTQQMEIVNNERKELEEG